MTDLPLFAEGSWWESLATSETLVKVLGVVLSASVIGPGALWIANLFSKAKIRSLRQQLDVAEKRAADATEDRDELRVLAKRNQRSAAEATAKVTQLAEKYEKAFKYGHTWRDYAKKLEFAIKTWREQIGHLEVTNADLSAANRTLGSQAQHFEGAAAKSEAIIFRNEARIRRALKLEGRLWSAKALAKVPRFRSLDERRTPIISVVNLKGGVGKTTTTAHLGMALARRGYRVLLVDLDLQGSLTSLFHPSSEIGQLHAKGRLLQHFFHRSAEDKSVKLLPYAVPVATFPEASGQLSLVGTSDLLAYEELNLTVRWLFGEGNRDVRFILRKALHLNSLSNSFDAILLDCPPFVNVSCINAFAASDYLLIPINPSRKSLERVPHLASKFLRDERFCKYINPHLRVLGLVANRTWRATLTNDEDREFKIWLARYRDAFKVPIALFPTAIAQMKEIAQNEPHESAGGVSTAGSFFPIPSTDSKIYSLFNQLAVDIEGALPSECRRTAKTLS